LRMHNAVQHWAYAGPSMCSTEHAQV
jgi:hypothetical protein